MDIEEPQYFETNFIFSQQGSIPQVSRLLYEIDYSQKDCESSTRLSSTSNSQLNMAIIDGIQQKSDNQAVVKKRKNQVKKQLRQAGYSYLTKKITSKNIFTIQSGLSVTSDGSLRLCYSLSQVCFGFQSQDVNYVQEQNDIDSVEINLRVDQSLQNFSVEDALEIVKNASFKNYEKIKDSLRTFHFRTQNIKKQLQLAEIPKQFFDQKDQQFGIYVSQCIEYLKEYQKENPFQMYQYVIGRFNIKQGDIEIDRVGFSKSYIHFLGLDLPSFKTMILRQQQIDLIKEQGQIVQQSLQGLLSFIDKQSENEELVSDIQTFDGFTIKLYQRKKAIQLSPSPDLCKTGHIFYIREMDVDINDLQKLISYRQRIEKNNLNLDQFIDKEMSYLFEDVEYSVHSQSFIERYYQENLKQLEEIMRREKQTCGYKPANNHNSNLIQIESSIFSNQRWA